MLRPACMITPPRWQRHTVTHSVVSVPLQPLWCSPFRPFFLLGALYGLALILSWVPFYTGLLQGQWPFELSLPALYHQHEMVFGFATAIVFGFIMTALPSWAGTDEITGFRLFVLVLAWVMGRLFVALSSMLPLTLVALVDLAFLLLFATLVGSLLRNVRFEISLGLALITALFFTGNLCYYLGVVTQDNHLWQSGLRLGLYAVVFHCSVTVGVLAPIFTENALREKGQPTLIGHIQALEWLSALSILALAAADIFEATPPIIAALALASGLLHLVRLCRWRSFSIATVPIVWVLHFGYLWLLVALWLRAVVEISPVIDTEGWVHIFTVGGFGLMSLGLMTRVTLRHTGRELRPAPAMIAGYLCLALATTVRVLIPATSWRNELLLLSALLWAMPYLIYLLLYGRMLVSSSLPE